MDSRVLRNLAISREQLTTAVHAALVANLKQVCMLCVAGHHFGEMCQLAVPFWAPAHTQWNLYITLALHLGSFPIGHMHTACLPWSGLCNNLKHGPWLQVYTPLTKVVVVDKDGSAKARQLARAMRTEGLFNSYVMAVSGPSRSQKKCLGIHPSELPLPSCELVTL